MYERIKNDILGKKYSLSIALISAKKSREINKKYRKKDKPTNILSFAFHKNEGEILLCPSIIKKEVKKFGRNYEELAGFLVIHGMLHLKGYEHSSKMERAEQQYDKKYFYRHRRRLLVNQGHRGRVSKRRKKS
jgi:probable rRNA maturation factor